MKTGKAEGLVEVSMSVSGMTDTASWVTSTSMRATVSPWPGSWPEPDGALSAGSDGCPSWAPPGVSADCTVTSCGALPPSMSWPAESHIRAGGALKTVMPLPSTAARFPAAPSRTVRFCVSRPKVSFSSSSLAAASGVFTTRTYLKLSGVAVTCRSTSLSTSGYTALGPSRRGAGNLPGQSSAKERPWSSIRASGPPSPPPENAICTAAPFGPTVPSERFTRVGSGACHSPSAAGARTGVEDSSSVNV